MAVRTLLTDLAEKAIEPIRRKSWFAGEHVQMGDYLRRAQLLYESGVVMGHYFRERMEAFVQLICEPGKELEMRAILGKSAAAQFERVGGNPRDFYELFFKAEVERLMEELRRSGSTKASDWGEWHRIARKKLLISDAMAGLETATRKGIAFGSQHWEPAAKLLASRPDPENWSRVRAGRRSDWPESPPAPRPMGELQSQALRLIRPYVETYRFDLLARLGLWFETHDSTYLRWRALLARQDNQ